MSDVAMLDGTLHPATLPMPRSGGLPCRAQAANCRVAFRPVQDTVEEIQRAARARDGHEVRVHGYTHTVVEVLVPDFTRARPVLRRTQP